MDAMGYSFYSSFTSVSNELNRSSVMSFAKWRRAKIQNIQKVRPSVATMDAKEKASGKS